MALEALGVDQLVIAGAMSHMCIEGATRAAADFGYKCRVIHDACATRDQEWNGRIVPAAEFLQVAEQSGLIIEMSTWVMRHAAQAVTPIARRPGDARPRRFRNANPRRRRTRSRATPRARCARASRK